MTVPVFRAGALGRGWVGCKAQGGTIPQCQPCTCMAGNGVSAATLCAPRCLPGLTLKALRHSAYMSKWLRWPQWTRRKNFSCFQVAACGEAIGSTLPYNVPLISNLVSG